MYLLLDRYPYINIPPARGYPPGQTIQVIVNGGIKTRALQSSYNFPQKAHLELPHSL
jgi:hypothetical protein